MTAFSRARAALAASRRTAVFSGAGLSAESGIPTFRGNERHPRCNGSCGYEEAIDLANPPPLRRCARCGEYLRPAVVWFGEALPGDIWSEAQRLCSAVDCLIVVGTSAVVYPAASLIEDAAAAGSTIISINMERSTGASGTFGPKHIELVGTASTLLPQLLDGLSFAPR